MSASSSSIPQHAYDAISDSSDFGPSDPHQAAVRHRQIAALRLAEAQLAAARRSSTAPRQLAARVTFDDNLETGSDLVAPSPATASTGPRAAVSAGVAIQSQMVLEERRELMGSRAADSQPLQTHPAVSSCSDPIGDGDISQMKAQIHAVMAQLARARELARRQPDRIQEAEPPHDVVSHDDAEPPREGAAWEAARLEAERALANAAARGTAAGTGIATPPTPTGTLRVKRLSTQEQREEKFEHMVQLQMDTQEAMRRRMELTRNSLT